MGNVTINTLVSLKENGRSFYKRIAAEEVDCLTA